MERSHRSQNHEEDMWDPYGCSTLRFEHAVSKAVVKLKVKDSAYHSKQALLCSFDELYSQLLVASGLIGPLAVSSSLWLVLRYAAWKPRLIDWCCILEQKGKKVECMYFYLKPTLMLAP